MFRKANALTALNPKKEKKIWPRPSRSWLLLSENDKCQKTVELAFSFIYKQQTTRLSHCGGSRLQCAVPGPGSPRGTPSCGPTPGQSSTWGWWNTWSGSTCSQTHWLHSHKEMNGGSCGTLRLQEKRMKTIKIEILNQKPTLCDGRPTKTWNPV